MSDVKFEPWEQLMLLDRQIEELSPSQRALVEPFSAAALTVVRQMMGQKTVTEAHFAVDRARQALEDARKRAAARKRA